MSLLIPIAVFVGVAALVGGVALLLRGRTEEVMEDRLAQLAGRPRQSKDTLIKQGVLSQPLEATQSVLADFFASIAQLRPAVRAGRRHA